MNILNSNAIHELIEYGDQWCVSMFLPMHAGSRDQKQDAIRMKNLIRSATEQLIEHGLRQPDANQMLQPAEQVRLEFGMGRQRGEGLACFCSDEFFRSYDVPLRLEEHLHVNRRFHVKPLLPLLRSNARFYILALSQENAMLYESTQHAIRKVDLPEIERAEIDGTEQALQYHSHQAPSQGKGSVQEAVYHGHGGPEDRTKTDVLHYFQRVDRAVMTVLRGQRAPLVLACVGYLASIYESANNYAHLVKAKVPGSPTGWSLDELRRHAWQLVEPDLQRDQTTALEQLQQARNSQRASADIREIVLAADTGRIQSLFIEQGTQRWGRIKSDKQTVELRDEANGSCEELLDYAAARTLGNGGAVYSMEAIPNVDSPIAATYRY